MSSVARTADEISRFYDVFSHRLVRDYVYGNPRVTAALMRVRSAIGPAHAKVLDVGCGIGASSEFVAQHCPWVSVHGVDISTANIDAAKRLFGQSRIRFSVSAMDQPPEGGPFDVIAMMDVYEHVPRAQWPSFNEVLSNSMSADGVLILTTPTPLHQQYLAEHNPEGLQIVDETVELDDILSLRETIGGMLTCYKCIDIWRTNDYLHVVINRKPLYHQSQRRSQPPKSLWQRLRSRVVDEQILEIRRRKVHVLDKLGSDVD